MMLSKIFSEDLKLKLYSDSIPILILELRSDCEWIETLMKKNNGIPINKKRDVKYL